MHLTNNLRRRCKKEFFNPVISIYRKKKNQLSGSICGRLHPTLNNVAKMPAEAPLLILQRGAFSLVQLEVNMSEHKKENGQEDPSKEKSKNKEPTLADKAVKMFGYKKGELPKDWVRIFFKK